MEDVIVWMQAAAIAGQVILLYLHKWQQILFQYPNTYSVISPPLYLANLYHTSNLQRKPSVPSRKPYQYIQPTKKGCCASRKKKAQILKIP
jgi:hypothetical protein